MNKGDQTRQMIVEKSADLFNRLGYDGCSLSDIMTATSLKKGGIYNHFDSKDEIALAAFDYSFQQVISRYRSKLKQETSPLEKLKKMFEMFKYYFDHPYLQGGCPIANTAVYSTDAHPLLQKRVISAIEQMEAYIAIKIDQCKELGLANQEVNSSVTAQMILSAVEGAIVLSRVRNNKVYLKNTVDQLEELIIEKLFK